MSFPLPICASCGRPAFPPRVVCPLCGHTTWETPEAARGVVEQLTERDDFGIAAVRTELGPVVVARALDGVAVGGAVDLAADGAVPIARSA